MKWATTTEKIDIKRENNVRNRKNIKTKIVEQNETIGRWLQLILRKDRNKNTHTKRKF